MRVFPLHQKIGYRRRLAPSRRSRSPIDGLLVCYLTHRDSEALTYVTCNPGGAKTISQNIDILALKSVENVATSQLDLRRYTILNTQSCGSSVVIYTISGDRGLPEDISLEAII